MIGTLVRGIGVQYVSFDLAILTLIFKIFSKLYEFSKL